MTRFSFVIFCRLALLKTCSNRIPNFHFLYYSLVLPRFFVLWKTDYLLEIDLFKADFQLFERSVIRTKLLSSVEVRITGSLLYYFCDCRDQPGKPDSLYQLIFYISNQWLIQYRYKTTIPWAFCLFLVIKGQILAKVCNKDFITSMNGILMPLLVTLDKYLFCTK